MTAKVWTPEQVLALGVRTDAETAGSIFGLSRTQAYEAVNRDRFPVPVFRVGRRIVVPVAPILQLLGLNAEAAGPPSTAAITDERPTTAKRTDDDAHRTGRKLRALGG